MSSTIDTHYGCQGNYRAICHAADCLATTVPQCRNTHFPLRMASQAAGAHYCQYCNTTRTICSASWTSFTPPILNPEPPRSWQHQRHRALQTLHHGPGHGTFNSPSCYLMQSATAPSSTQNGKSGGARSLLKAQGTAGAGQSPSGSHSLHLTDYQSPTISRRGSLLDQPLGPPEKPAQSQFAVWVGNLPLHTDLLALKDYFSHHAIRDIVSIKYIRKSSCAFVNYRSLDACFHAIRRLDRQYFFGNKLICRARTYTEDGKAIRPALTDHTGRIRPTEASSGRTVTPEKSSKDTGHPQYFILKSLTAEDLEASVRSGIWTTQPHNRDVLNEAYRESQDVWLIFSVNQSHEFFGVARMISDSESIDTGQGTTADTTTSSPVGAESCYVHVAASRWAPPGIIFEDKLRDVLWWQSTMQDNERKQDPDGKIHRDGTRSESSMYQSQATKAFKVQWVSLRRVPFRRVRGMVNRLNDDRPVQMARDGTPLAKDAGQKLLTLFGIPHAQKLSPGELTQALSGIHKHTAASSMWAEDPFAHFDPSTTPTAASFGTSARSSSSRSSIGTMPSLTACSSFSSAYSAVDSSKAPSVADTIDDEEPLPPGPVVNGSLGRCHRLSL